MITTILALSVLGGENVAMKFIAEGATARSGGYRPVRAEFSATAPAALKKKPSLTNPMYGFMQFGSKSVLFILDDTESPKIYVDANGNGDLTDDPAAKYAARTQNGMTMYNGGASVDIGKGQPAKVNFYRFDPKDPARAALKNTLLYYGDFGYEITLDLGGKAYTTFIAGEPTDGMGLTIDRDGNGKKSFFYEALQVGKPFNFTGTTYVLNFNNGALSLDKASTAVPLTPMPPDLEVGKKTLQFKARATDGSEVSFPESYKGKIVMLDFWATWCGPCIAELPNVLKAYSAYHDKGFEILGISFDQANKAEVLAKFTEEKKMPWRQVYEGKYWDTTIGKQFDVAAIPFCLLVDGDTGEILATVKDLRGEAIMTTIEKALAKKKGF